MSKGVNKFLIYSWVAHFVRSQENSYHHNKMNIFLFTLFLTKTIHSLQILFAPGSNIQRRFYVPFLKKLENKIKHPVNFYDDFNNFNDKHIVIAHSFGGTTSICNYLMNKDTNNVLGSIIINCHFNQRNKMPYFPINQNEVKIPVLTILNSKDEQLPLHASIDDFLVSHQEDIPNKYYYINPGTHYSTFEDPLQMEIVTSQIANFIQEIKRQRFNQSHFYKHYLTNRHSWFFQDRHLPNTRIQPNFPSFLVSNPYKNNSIYLNHKYVLFKTKNINIVEYLDDYYHLHMNYSQINLYNIYYKDIFNSSHAFTKIIDANPMKLSHNATFLQHAYFTSLIMEYFIKDLSNDFLYKSKIPSFLVMWFTYEPRIMIIDNKLTCEVLTVPIRDGIVYYKFPSKHKVFEFLSQQNLI